MTHPKDPHEELLQRYLDGKCTHGEAEALMAWLQENGHHKALLQQMQAEFSQTVNTTWTVNAPPGKRKH